MKNALAIIILSILAFLTGSFLANIFPQSTVPEESAFGSTNAVGGTSYYLYGSGVAAADTSITLTSFKQPVNQYPLTITDFGSIGYLTLEPGNSLRQEFISFSGVTQNADGTATLTGVTRGLAPVSPYTASTTIRKAHGGGTIAVLSNPPQFYERFANKDNTQYITGAWGFQGTAPTSTECATANELCNKNYIDSGILAGAANASLTVKGIVEIATAAEAAAGTSAGGTAALLALPASLSTSTPNAATATGNIPTSIGRYLSQTWLDLTSAWTFTATTTVSSAPLITSETTLATSTNMTINFGTGNKQLIRNGTGALTVGFTNATAGQSLLLTICNPNASGGAVTFTGVLWPGGTAPVTTTTAKKCDIITLNATNATSTLVIMGGFNLNY